jgi:hypothetical protein
MPLLNLLTSAKLPWKGFESFLIQRLHAYSYREDVKLSYLPWSPTQMGLGPFGLPCKGTPWSLEQVTILNENNKTTSGRGGVIVLSCENRRTSSIAKQRWARMRCASSSRGSRRTCKACTGHTSSTMMIRCSAMILSPRMIQLHNSVEQTW